MTSGVDDGGGFSDELTAVLAGARRRAFRDGDRQIDTAHLLHSLLDHDPGVRAVLDGHRLARLLGYLAQRSIGYGLRWQGGVEDSGALPVVPAPDVRGPRGGGPGGGGPGGDGLSPLAALAVREAGVRALRQGRTAACGLDLLASIVTDPQARAVEVLGRAGVDVARLRDGAGPAVSHVGAVGADSGGGEGRGGGGGGGASAPASRAGARRA